MNLKEKRTLQFELWQECNNLCTFCYLGKENRKTPDILKIEALKRAIDIVSDTSNYPKFNCIGLIGGEFFQGQLKNSTVKTLFYKLIDKIAELYNREVIQEFWVSATLTIGKQKELYEILGKFKNTKNVWVVTSWDAVGRFKTKKMLDNWEYHVKHLREVYPDLKVNCCIVLSGVLIDRYLSGDFGTFSQFALNHDLSLFFKQPSPFVNLEKDTLENRIISIKASNEVIPNFHPTRKKFIEFLIKFKNQESENLWGRLFNVQYRSDELVRSLNDGSVADTIREKDKMGSEDDMPLQKCGHTVNYMPYCDEVRCCICDKLKIGSFS